MRKKPNLVPRMERCSHLLIETPEKDFALRGHWRDLMPQAAQLHLELGCGKGRFTVETAAQNPDILHIAVERVPDAMVIAMERANELGLTNVFFVDDDARRLPELFAPGEVDCIYINFCDPWPGHRHSRRRLTAVGFLELYRQVLKDGGQIHFKTDNRDLYEWSLFQFPKAAFQLSEVTRNLHEKGICGVMTDYEEKFHNMGTPINRCVGTKLFRADLPASAAEEDAPAAVTEE
ncbi:MAG: tRNA (guanosine(46)-N7)-methyltransferase TrmB [Oscillospiraceae bacterium]|nr:tRNA (guanosine(46)-N7)-methyltransferase TrmB [Oscillospiraceae bacterium]